MTKLKWEQLLRLTTPVAIAAIDLAVQRRASMAGAHVRVPRAHCGTATTCYREFPQLSRSSLCAAVLKSPMQPDFANLNKLFRKILPNLETT